MTTRAPVRSRLLAPLRYLLGAVALLLEPPRCAWCGAADPAPTRVPLYGETQPLCAACLPHYTGDAS